MNQQENEMIELYKKLEINISHIKILEVLAQDEVYKAKLDVLLDRKEGEISD